MTAAAGKIPHPMMFALLAAVFSVSAGYGVMLPILPQLIGEVAGANAAVARHTGLVLGLFMLALAIFAPIWGWFSDRHGRRPALLLGLTGMGTSALIFAAPSGVLSIYLERFISGTFAASVLPVAFAVMGDFAATEHQRALRISWLSMAAVAGFLLGPMLGGSVALFLPFPRSLVLGNAYVTPLLLMAVLAFLAALAIRLFVPLHRRGGQVDRPTSEAESGKGCMLLPLLALSFLAAGGLGAFEVGLTLRGQQTLAMTPARIAAIFAECSLVMFLAQAAVFTSPLKPATTRWFIAPALLSMATGIFMIPTTGDFALLLAWVGMIAAGAGVLLPILTYWVSFYAGETQGADLGKQTSAANLGQALGSTAGGALFGVSVVPGGFFSLTALLLLLGAAVGLGVSRGLTPSSAIQRHREIDRATGAEAHRRSVRRSYALKTTKF